MTGLWLLAAIELSGLIGTELQTRAFFDAHNVKVGDPMELTVDFLGEADFGSLHPPALSKQVSSRDFKLDDISAKTDTLGSGRQVYGRRLTYRVRPRRAGVLTFPRLEFSYRTPQGKIRTISTRAMPVHAKVGRQVAVAEIGEDLTAMPMPDPLITECPATLSDDDEFAWRKACAAPTAAAFQNFDFPAARLNEARQDILEGNWAQALKIYRILEWRIGQTPAIERGMVAAWARKFENPAAELPVWRQVGRPLLKFAWPGRLLWVLGSLLALVLIGWLINRGIRAVAVFAAVLLWVLPLNGEECVEESVVTNADGSVVHRVIRSSSGRNGSMSFSFSSSSGGNMSSSFGSMPSLFDDDFFASPFGRRRKAEPVRINSTAKADRDRATVGENFRIVLAVEMPRRVSFAEGLRFTLEERPGLRLVGEPFQLDERKSTNPTNIIRRYAFPYRSMQPLKGALKFTVAGEVVTGGFGLFRSTVPYRQEGWVRNLAVEPLPTAGCPKDFFGVVSEQAVLTESVDMSTVETNDVLTITYRLRTQGYIPRGVLPEPLAYEWQRSVNDDAVEYKRYFVADGAKFTPEFSISYYDPNTHKYRRTALVSTPINYSKSTQK